MERAVAQQHAEKQAGDRGKLPLRALVKRFTGQQLCCMAPVSVINRMVF